MRYLLPYSLVLFGVLTAYGQNDKRPLISKADLKVNLIEVGPYLAIPVGDSFISESDYELGFELGSSIIWKNLLFGVGYNQFNLKNHDFTRTGYQGQTRNSAFYLKLGYQYPLSTKAALGLDYSLGQATYKSELFDSPEDFNDNAFYNNLTLRYSYDIGKLIALNAYAGYRIDFLNIDVPSELSNLYDNASYFNAGLSLSLFVD